LAFYFNPHPVFFVTFLANITELAGNFIFDDFNYIRNLVDLLFFEHEKIRQLFLFHFY
jgi:hypothetical protein